MGHLVSFPQTAVSHQAEEAETKSSLIVSPEWGSFTEMRAVSTGATATVLVTAREGRLFAVKRLPKSERWSTIQFIRECVALSKLKHPGIVKMYDMGEDEKCFYIFQEYYSGGTLKRFIDDRGNLSEKIVKSFVRQLLSALAYMHSCNFVHRDIKLANIMMVDEHRLVLIDFGQATQVSPESRFWHMKGTPMYHAPECYRKYRNGDDLKKVDVWMVGICMYVMMSGKWPWQCKDLHTLRRDVCTREPFVPRDFDYSGACRYFLRSLLVKRPANRPSACAALESAWLTPLPKKLEDAGGKRYDDVLVPHLDEMQFDVDREKTGLAWMQDGCV